jgi:CheY-like chemotaxis protein
LSLTGNLEDLPLLDIIQIVSFSRKTGCLSIAMAGGEGGIVFRSGLVVAAFTAESPPADPRLASLPPERRDRAIRARIVFALEQLARLREGAFGFELTDDVPRTLGARNLTAETLEGGINPQDLLLDLASGIDAGRAESAAAVEASFAAPEEGVVEGEEEGAAIVPAEALASDMEHAGPGPEEAPAPGPAVAPMPPPPEPPAAPARPPSLEPRASRARSEPPAPAPSPPPAPHPGGARTILLVDDEPDVREILGRHFSSAGFTIEEAGDPDAATRAAGRLRTAETPFVVVTDLGMPASGGASFHGGFEVVKRLWKMNLRPPVVMMTENLSPSLRLRARQMGVQAFVFKPTLSKLNPRQYEADLSAFAFKLSADVLPRLAERATLAPVPRRRKPSPPRAEAPASPPAGETAPFEFLRRRLRDLGQPGDANEIAVLVMKVAREFFERAILFVVKGEEARGLGGFGLAPRDETLNLLARTIAIPLADPSLFREVAEGRRSFVGLPPGDRWTTHLMGRIGRFRSRGVALLPLVAHRETIALLFGDSPETGREPEGLDALEVFVHQAGIALENVFLQKKLQALQAKDAPGVR